MIFADKINTMVASPQVRIAFFDPDYYPDTGITYALVAARFRGEWIFVRHRGKTAWEMPAGHIEEGETPEEAAGRELAEETGATEFRLQSVATYSVEKDGVTRYGRLFFAEIKKMKHIGDYDEIEEIICSRNLPSDIAYPDIQPVLFSRVFRYVQKLPS
ncbi:MAG: NUDIX hydrolase [Bacteroidales bacterium]